MPVSFFKKHKRSLRLHLAIARSLSAQKSKPLVFRDASSVANAHKISVLALDNRTAIAVAS